MSLARAALLTVLLALVACGPVRPTDPDDDDASDEENPEDLDGDGYCPDTECEDDDLTPGDCDDNDSTSHADAEELCDGVDNDCDERIDEDFDADQDGYVDQFGEGCLSNFSSEELDCNDQIAAINPGAD